MQNLCAEEKPETEVTTPTPPEIPEIASNEIYDGTEIPEEKKSAGNIHVPRQTFVIFIQAVILLLFYGNY